MKTQQLSSFSVAGYSTRTNNNIESTAASRIAQLWHSFMRDNPAALLSEKLGDEIYAVYSQYATDHNGDYTLTLGYKVPSEITTPAGLVTAKVPAGRYVILSSEVGPAASVVPSLWQKIWSMTPSELGGVRSYQSDFELYDSRSANPQQAQVDIYLGLVS